MASVEVCSEFERLGGKMVGGFPVIDSVAYKTVKGTPYLKAPGVAMISMPNVSLSGAQGFLDGFDEKLEFGDYLKDPDALSPAEALTKFAGQLCYASFNKKRTLNKDAQRYFDNIIASGHGSVLEHGNFSFLWYGIDRTLSHEGVRHRAGMAYSQLSQRYVTGRVLRFVERPEYQQIPKLHTAFEKRIDAAAKAYGWVSNILLGLQESGSKLLSAEAKTDLRKKVQQAARSVLPGETETSMVITGNVRALRHISYMRANRHAEIQIREAVFRSYLCLALIVPMLVNDFSIDKLSDGTNGVDTKFPKV